MLQARPRIARIPVAAKLDLRVLYLAKHASGDGSPDPVDGNHAVYHHEMRTTLEAIGLNVATAQTFDVLERRPEADFVLPMLNRGGFTNSEMLGPLLLTRFGIPFLGASPILRGLSDDKHLMKLCARMRDVPTVDWATYRRGGSPVEEPAFRAERLVVKPNASSASWGLAIVDSWGEARRHVAKLLDEGHDVIVEPWAPLIDVAVPVIGGAGSDPWLLPPLAYMPADPGRARSYAEKRALVASEDDPLVAIEDAALVRRLSDMTRALCRELWPFDYGRFEFRYDPATGAVRFMEVNLSCNLWSRKTISRSAATLGISHGELVESIVAHSLARQGVLARYGVRQAA